MDMNSKPHAEQWQQPWQPRTQQATTNAMPSNNNYRPDQAKVDLHKNQQSGFHRAPPRLPEQQQQQQDRNQSRGRTRPQQIETISTATNAATHDVRNLHSNSNTPRRKGNPQSPQLVQHSNPREQSTHVDSLELHRSRSRSNSSSRIPNLGGSVDLSTPLATLSTVLTTAKSYHACAIKSYRVNHKLFRDAKDRTAKAQLALAQAKAEYEHATTAQEYAHSELTASLATKQQCEAHTLQIEKQVRKLGQQLKGKRVKLVGLTQNVQWNRRSGVIVKLVIEGEDCGRWKVRLDKEQRGGDPEGMDGRDSLNGEASGDVAGNDEYGRRQNHDEYYTQEEKDECNKSSHHVVAKAENLELLEVVDPIGFVGSAAAASIVKTRTPRGMAASGGSSGKSRDPSTSRYGESFEGDNSTPAVVSPNRGDYIRGVKNAYRSSSSYRDERPMPSPLSPPHIMTQRASGKDISSAFSNMLLSPVSFDNVSFTPIPTNSFASPTNKSVERLQKYNVVSPANGFGDGWINKSDNSVAASFFEEGTSQEQTNHFEFTERDHDLSREEIAYDDFHCVDNESHRGYPQEVYSTDLPTLVILPVEDDEETDYGAPHCIGVKGAGVPHINGVYLLANQQNDTYEDPPSSPLYFKDAPPTLLEDDRYYDMCILRINCPDSKNHVIWFLSRVDVDPTCLDVKFSDCYYYCRVHRDNDNNGMGSRCPPLSGWNIPKVPPGIAIAPSTSFSLESEGYHANELDDDGIGISPMRTADRH